MIISGFFRIYSTFKPYFKCLFQWFIELQRPIYSSSTNSLKANQAISLLQDCPCVVGLSQNNIPLRLWSEINYYYYYYRDPLYYNLHGEINLRYIGLEVLIGFHSMVDLFENFFFSVHTCPPTILSYGKLLSSYAYLDNLHTRFRFRSKPLTRPVQ